MIPQMMENWGSTVFWAYVCVYMSYRVSEANLEFPKIHLLFLRKLEIGEMAMKIILRKQFFKFSIIFVKWKFTESS